MIETVKTTKLAEENYAIDKFNGFYAKMSSYFGDLVKSWCVVYRPQRRVSAPPASLSR